MGQFIRTVPCCFVNNNYVTKEPSHCDMQEGHNSLLEFFS